MIIRKKVKKKSLKPCNFCGGLDHQRKSNRLCPFYNGGGGNPTTAIKDGQNVSKDGVIKLSKKRKASPKKKARKRHPLRSQLPEISPNQLSSNLQTQMTPFPTNLSLMLATKTSDPMKLSSRSLVRTKMEARSSFFQLLTFL